MGFLAKIRRKYFKKKKLTKSQLIKLYLNKGIKYPPIISVVSATAGRKTRLKNKGKMKKILNKLTKEELALLIKCDGL